PRKQRRQCSAMLDKTVAGQEVETPAPAGQQAEQALTPNIALPASDIKAARDSSDGAVNGEPAEKLIVPERDHLTRMEMFREDVAPTLRYHQGVFSEFDPKRGAYVERHHDMVKSRLFLWHDKAWVMNDEGETKRFLPCINSINE